MIAREKIALIAITKHGTGHAQRLQEALPGSRLFVAKKFESLVSPAASATLFEKPIKDLTAEIFNVFDALVYIVSLGAVIRTIAPFIKDKHTDPAVIVIDDKAEFAISVLSGHVGGANELTEEIAKILNSMAVITTASDVGKTIPVDILGREFGWIVEGEENITKVSAAVVNEEPIALYQDAGERNWWKRETLLPKNIHLVSWEELKSGNYSAYLLISDRLFQDERTNLLNRAVVYRPKSLDIGIGCDRGVTVEEIESLVRTTFQEHRLSTASIRNIASITLKRDERGLTEFAQKWRLPITFYSQGELKNIEVPNPSAKVLKYAGTPGVSEPAAMLSAGTDRLVVEKTKIPRVTLAVARVEFKGGVV